MNKKLNISDKEKNNFYKTITVIEIIIALFLIVSIIIIIEVTSTDKENLFEISNFEKIGLYHYFEEDFIDYNLLSNSSMEQGNEGLTEENKMVFVVSNYFSKNNQNKISEEQFIEEYKNIFAKEPEEDISIVELYSQKYMFNIEERTIEKRAENDINFEEENSNYIYKVTDIEKTNKNYLVTFDVCEQVPNEDLGPIDSYMPDEYSVEPKEEYIGKATLTLSVEDGKYIIVDFIQELNI